MISQRGYIVVVAGVTLYKHDEISSVLRFECWSGLPYLRSRFFLSPYGFVTKYDSILTTKFPMATRERNTSVIYAVFGMGMAYTVRVHNNIISE